MISMKTAISSQHHHHEFLVILRAPFPPTENETASTSIVMSMTQGQGTAGKNGCDCHHHTVGKNFQKISHLLHENFS